MDTDDKVFEIEIILDKLYNLIHDIETDETVIEEIYTNLSKINLDKAEPKVLTFDDDNSLIII